MPNHLADFIRSNNLPVFKMLLSTPGAESARNKTFTLTPADMAQIQKLNNGDNAKRLKKLTEITDARLIFLAVLYDRLDFFQLLLPSYSVDISMTMGGVTLTDITLCLNHLSFFDVLTDTTGFKTYLGDSTTMWKQARGSTPLDKLKDAAEHGNLEDVNKYIREGVHHQDKDGEALSIALQYGRVKCADALQTAFLSITDNKILPKHYYASGMAENHMQMYYPLIVKPDQNTPDAPKKTFPTPPTFIMEGDLEALQCNVSKDTDELASWLFHSIANNHTSCVNYLLKNGAEVKPKHYYAAGVVSNKNVFDAQYYFDLLVAVATGAQKREAIKLSWGPAQSATRPKNHWH